MLNTFCVCVCVYYCTIAVCYNNVAILHSWLCTVARLFIEIIFLYLVTEWLPGINVKACFRNVPLWSKLIMFSTVKYLELF